MRLIIPLLPILLTLTLCPWGPPAWAQQEPPDRLTDEVAGIHRTLNRLVELLEAAAVRSEADLLLRRISVLERRMAPLQGQLSGTQGEVHNLETEIRRLQAMGADVETAIDEDIRKGTDAPDSESRQMQGHFRAELKQLLEQLEVAELRKRQAEDALGDAREDIEVLDDTLLELLNNR